MTASRSMPPRVSIAAGALWIIAVAAGFYVLIHYSLAPGRPGRPPEQWPAASSLGREPSRPTLVLVVHPRCPCTRASLTELAEIMTQCPGALAARVLFVRPAGLTDDWVRSDLWRSVQSIPGVTAVIDPEGQQAKQFGAFTSGQAALYDSEGRLVFHGGLTSARGETGAGPGERAIVEFVNHGEKATLATPVFGCPLEKPGTSPGAVRKDPSCLRN